MIKKLVSGLYLVSMLMQAQAAQPLDEITIHEPAFTVILDRQIEYLCQHVVDLWQRAGYECPDENLQMLLDPNTQELDYETVLRALHQCVHSEWEPRSDEEKELVRLLEQIYKELTEEYDQLIKQLATRKIKCKCYTKVTAKELVAWNACFEKVVVKNKLIVDNLNGVVQANAGCLTAGLVDGDGIEDGAITNSKLADNSVTNNNLADNSVTNNNLADNSVTNNNLADNSVTNNNLADNSVTGNKIVNSSLLSTHLSFNTVDTFSSEPDLLRLYRGSVNGGTGATISGAGFMSLRTGFGAYTITFMQGYNNALAYQIFVQTFTEFDRNVTITAQAAGSFSISVVTNAGVPVDQDFMFFTIGDR